MRDAKFQIGDVVRIGVGVTSLMGITEILHDARARAGIGYGGIACCGGYVHALQSKCKPASAVDLAVWLGRQGWRRSSRATLLEAGGRARAGMSR